MSQIKNPANTPALNDESFEASQTHTIRFTRTVCLVAFVIIGLLSLLSLAMCLLVSWQAWGSSAIGATLAWLPAGCSWWLTRYTSKYRLAAWTISVTSVLIAVLIYWQSPFFGIYLIFLFLLTIIRVILGRLQAFATFGIFLLSTLAYAIANRNDFYAPDGQLVKVGYDTFALWWIVIGGTLWLTSLLYDRVQHDNHILSLQARELKQALEELRLRQTASENVSRQVLTMGSELSLISQQQLVGSEQQLNALTEVASLVAQIAHSADNIEEQTTLVKAGIGEINQSTLRVQATSQEALAAGNGGQQAINSTVTATQKVSQQYELLRHNLADLQQFQAQIETVIATINAISREIHLLSLNAALEAAGAGTFGERFLVVAGEVRNLAQRSQQASAEVGGILGKIEAGITQVAQSAQAAQAELEIALAATGESDKTIQVILEALHLNAQEVAHTGQIASAIARQILSVNQATLQQVSATSQSAHSVLEIKAVAAQNSTVSNRLTQSASDLEQVSARLLSSLTA